MDCIICPNEELLGGEEENRARIFCLSNPTPANWGKKKEERKKEVCCRKNWMTIYCCFSAGHEIIVLPALGVKLQRC